MPEMKAYSDRIARFTYPRGYKLHGRHGQYVLTRGKETTLLLSVLPRRITEGVFDAMATVPPPGDRTKTVHREYTLGGRKGRAISWEVFGPDAILVMRGCEFFFDDGDWSVVAKMSTSPPADAEELEQIVGSLQLL